MHNFDLTAAGLPDPLDTERTTCFVAGGPWTVAHVIAGWTAPDAIAAFLSRAGVVDAIRTAAYEGRSTNAVTVIADGWDDEGEFGWSIQRVTVPGPTGHDACYTVVDWTDGVAQYEVQLVEDQRDGYEFLDALRAVVSAETDLPERWRDAVPLPSGDVEVTLQLMTTLQVEEGRAVRPVGKADVDLDFVVALTVDGVTYEVENGRYLPDDAPAAVARLWARMCSTPQPTLDFDQD